MLYEDRYGKLLVQDEVEELFAWEVMDREIHASGIYEGIWR